MDKTGFNDGWYYGKKDADGKTLVTLPHDAMILEQRHKSAPGGAAVGYFPGGVYVYEKSFAVPQEWKSKHVFLVFEGVYRNAQVYVNGSRAGGCAYGYSPFTVVLDNLLQYGQENVVRVEADNSQMPNSRWYTGSGIYRPVWLYIAKQAHIRHQGVRISTLSYSPARILVETDHTGQTNDEVHVEIIHGSQVVAAGTGARLELDVPDARLWSAETPNLYFCRVRLSREGNLLDEVEETFGIRRVEWSPGGLFVNGCETLLRGACVHHDNGILGARSYAESEERRVRILKQAGYNAIRSSHNPASKAMLNACDRYGMYMVDETWDLWYSHKSKYDYAAQFMENYRYDIRAMVERDFNHPSVIMYSICNEISEPKDKEGLAFAKEMIDNIHKLDNTRAVTGGVNLMILNMAAKGKGIYKEGGGRTEDKSDEKKATGSLLFNIIASKAGTSMNKAANSPKADAVASPFLDLLDIAGYNYASGRYPLEKEKHPDRVLYGSETFPQDIANNWEMVKRYPYLVGDFMWTGWDYLGEAGMGSWTYTGEGGFEKPYPWLLAEGGAIDILGNIGAEAVYAAVVWGLRKQPYIGVRPVNHPGVRVTKAVWRGTNAIESWAWNGCDGNKAEVEVYADAFEVVLQLNGKQLGKRRIKQFKAIFKTQYTPGNLTAVAYDRQGKETGSVQLSSAGPTGIVLRPEVTSAKPGDVIYVDVLLADSNGVVESNADTMLTVTVDGGELLAFGSANPRTEEHYNAGIFTTYYGRAQAVVRAGMGEAMTLTAGGGSLASVSATIPIDILS